MPLYEYACQDCDHTFEALVFNGETVECPECHGEHLERLLSVPNARVESTPLPVNCPPSKPPCGPGCCRQ